MTEELKPCPFCGEPPFVDNDRDGVCCICCPTNDCLGVEITCPTFDDAQSFWNRRTPVASAQGTTDGDQLCIARADIALLSNAMREACEFLMETKYGSPARSPGHNARVRLERALELVGVVPAEIASTSEYVLMPREATRDMTMAGCDCLPSCEHVFGHAGELLRNAYRKMVDAAGRHSPAVKSTQWCPGCSRDVEKACHHFQCPLGPNRSQPDSANEEPRG